MAEIISNNTDDLSKAVPFFKRAEEVAATDNFDYAIDMFIEGLTRAPDAVELGHKPLRHNSLIRQAKGGKKPSVIDKMRYSRGKTPLENMLNAEFLLAKDPENLTYAEQMLKAAVLGGFRKTVAWIADLIFETNRALERPSLQTFLLLKDSYAAIEEYAKAVSACGYACRLKPDDAALADDFKNLTANPTMQKGKYEGAGSFSQSIKDRESQEKFQMQQAVVKSVDHRQQAIAEARQVLAADNSPQNIFRLADTLTELQTDEADNDAIKLLNDSFEQFKDFTFKRRSGEILLRMLRRNIRKARVSLEKHPSNKNARDAFAETTNQLLTAELEHFRLCMENYPTDLRLKYEYGVRLMRNQRYDEAIPYLQEARKEPRHRISAMNKIGLCFFMKGWFSDAVDILKQAIEEYEIKDNDIAKDLRYNLARSYEQQGNAEESLELYRKIAQLDYAFKDVRARVDRLRKTAQQ